MQPAKRAARRTPQVIGPLQFDSELARSLGWLEAEILEVSSHLEHLNREHLERCALRWPAAFRRIAGRLVFVGPMQAPAGLSLGSIAEFPSAVTP